jgi:transglutaminase-like putative cysteine protease
MSIVASARYHILHETDYDYGGSVSLSHQMLHLSPRQCAWQNVRAHSCDVLPKPDWVHAGEDAFGNPVQWLNFDTPHERLRVRAEMDVEVFPHLPLSQLSDSIAWDELRERLSYRGAPPLLEDLAAQYFLFESTFVRIKHEFCDYGADCFTPGRPVLEATRMLMEKIFTEFDFDPHATTVATPVLEVLEKKRGVCQDFAHLMLACLRSHGIPARYMSGYLLTQPPPGQARLIGADASHAWVSVYAPGVGDGWVEFDPTNNLLPDTQHITLCWGRDFNDVSPMRGVILGGGGHEPEVEVTVMPYEELIHRRQSDDE